MADVIVKCPTCDKAVAWISSSTYRPFCSGRCRLIDLGEWADGNRAIPADAEHDDVTASDLKRD
ncbi:MAG: DNA gyrase inhibitor YacG [Gammaproteobacteria bacterium]|nr:DNA gyrase inhibitor YacG [Gammaproteobacteria bacterium]